MDEAARARWESRYAGLSGSLPAPAKVLLNNACLLDGHGQALDLACGLGGNALMLSSMGYSTSAWDIASNAIEQLQKMAKTQSIALQAMQRDVIANPPLPRSFDVIVVSRFLDRSLCPALMAALRPQGLLFYQTFVRDNVPETYSGPANKDYLLAENELLHLFSGLRIRYYQDCGTVGDRLKGSRNESMLVAQATAQVEA